MNQPDTQAFTAESSGISNLLLAPCLIAEAWDPAGPDPEPRTYQFLALWDTGATNSAITENVVNTIGLAPIGFANSNHAQGVTPNVPKYLINLSLPPQVVISGLEVSRVELMDNVDVLIGMDIINLGDLTVSNYEGKTVFSFRIPSQGRTDYVVSVNAQNARSNAMSREQGPSQATRERARRRRRR